MSGPLQWFIVTTTPVDGAAAAAERGTLPLPRRAGDDDVDEDWTDLWRVTRDSRLQTADDWWRRVDVLLTSSSLSIGCND